MKMTTNYAALVQHDRVHGSLYGSVNVFDDEMQRIFHEGWVYVAHESEVPRPGDYLARRIGRQPMMLTRDAQGGLHLLHDRCPHRGNKICPSGRGHAEHFVCSYHGWAFDSRGQFVSMPAAASFTVATAECAGERSMRAAPRLGNYGGFIFASLAAEGITLREHLGHAASMIDMLNGLSPTGRIRLDAGWMKHRMRGNWKGLLENHVDAYHLPMVHGSLMRANKDFTSQRDRKDTSSTRLRDLGMGHSEIDFSADFRARDVMMGWTGNVDPSRLPLYMAAMQAAHGQVEARRRLVDGPPHAVVFPNLLLAEMNIVVMEPAGPEETIQYTTPVLMDGGAELNQRSLRRCEGALGPAGLLLADDAEIADMVRQGLHSDQPGWVLLKRGAQDEEQHADGTRVGALKDETPQRAFWRHYKCVMEGATP